MEFLLRRMIMKRLVAVLVPVLLIVAGAYATGGTVPPTDTNTNTNKNIIDIDNSVSTSQNQKVYVVSGNSEGGSADSDSVSVSSLTNTSISEYEPRTPPVTVLPPYLPYWNHGGWGTVKAYFPNGPNSDTQVYERTFDPENPDDTRELRGVLESLSYESPLDVVGGLLNGVGVIFGGPDNYHHGRGFEISNSLIRNRRPNGKPLLVFVDSNVDTNLLRKAGYVYVGKISVEGKVDRNWDQVYDASIAETLPWDVDILLVSGGMKGVTVGSNVAFPGAGGAYSQPNYSISMFGAVSSGITEGKGKALMSSDGYRFCPELASRRRIPQSFYERVRPAVRTRQAPRQEPRRELREEPGHMPMPAPESGGVGRAVPSVSSREKAGGVRVSRRLWEMAGFDENQMVDYVIVE